MTRVILLSSLVALILTGCGSAPTQTSSTAPKPAVDHLQTCAPGEAIIKVGSGTVCAEIADEALERTRGLSGRPSMHEDRGMLFVFPQASVITFWMKGMQIPLDIIWIRAGEVVGVSENVPVMENGTIATRKPKTPIDMALEVNAGWAQRYGVSVGDRLDIQYQ